MSTGNGRHLRRAIWTYGYALVPPIARHRMAPMEALLDEGHTKARQASRTWEGRLINGEDVTHILVVCDTPDQRLEINRRLEVELTRLEAPFLITASIRIEDDSGPLRPGRSVP